jgi:hypothetical protein
LAIGARHVSAGPAATDIAARSGSAIGFMRRLPASPRTSEGSRVGQNDSG